MICCYFVLFLLFPHLVNFELIVTLISNAQLNIIFKYLQRGVLETLDSNFFAR